MLEVSGHSACTRPLVRYILNMIHAVACRISFVLHCPCPEVSVSYSPCLSSPLCFFFADTHVIWVPVYFLLCGGSWLGCTVVPYMRALFNPKADCQKLKPLDTPGTQPPFSDALVNHWLAETHCENSTFKIQVMHILIRS